MRHSGFSKTRHISKVFKAGKRPPYIAERPCKVYKRLAFGSLRKDGFMTTQRQLLTVLIGHWQLH